MNTSLSLTLNTGTLQNSSGSIKLLMEGVSEELAAMAESLKVSDAGRYPDGCNTRNQDEDCFYDCEETFHAEKTSLASNQTEITHSEGTTHKLLTESVRNPDASKESAQASNWFEETAATMEHEVPKNDTVIEDGAYERMGEEDERLTDPDLEFMEEATRPSEYDDEYLREAEKNLTEEEKESRKAESTALKDKGNTQFKNREYIEAQKSYTEALAVCPVCYSKERSVLFSNRAAARMHLEEKTDAISDCTKAIELNPDYVRAILRRAELHEQTEKLDEALEDYKTVLEKDPGIQTAREACCVGKLKDLGNMILRPFGLSTANFQVKQDGQHGILLRYHFVQGPPTTPTNNNNKWRPRTAKLPKPDKHSPTQQHSPALSHNLQHTATPAD
ncbi:Tetratricopeptide repeat protein 1 [Bagarius yarrelli]|uniref:Tetratricopeptide repeat protein 1 n=1 Tax=Bagarius yarrelli TaxID=175774 RepID=A0A556TX86_BAGYA|nr:Tetratricopeptide repeat protein 1 [Bagarius yarrelli]